MHTKKEFVRALYSFTIYISFNKHRNIKCPIGWLNIFQTAARDFTRANAYKVRFAYLYATTLMIVNWMSKEVVHFLDDLAVRFAGQNRS